MLGAVLATLLVQLPFISEPLTIDEAMYFAVAQSDALPYVDVLDQKPPVVYAWYKLALALGGGGVSEEALRLLAASVLCVTAFCVYRLGRSIADAGVGIAAAWLFAVLVANPVVVRDANTETFALLPFVLGLLAWTRAAQTGTRWLFAVAGVLLAVTVATKTTFAFPVLVLAFLAYRRSFRDALWLMAPFAALLALMPLPWVVTGHFADFWYANVTFNMHYSASVPVYLRPVASVRLLLASVGSLPVVVLASYGVFRSQELEARRWRWMLAGGVVGILATGLSLNYYLTALFPVLAIMAAFGVFALRERPWSQNRVAMWVLAVALVLACVRVLPIYGAGGPEETRTAKLGYGRDVVAYELTDWVRANAEPDDRVQVIGEAVHVYVLTGREPMSRVLHTRFPEFDPALEKQATAPFFASMPEIVVELVEYEHEERNELFRAAVDANYDLVAEFEDAGSRGYAFKKR